jgi:hypothetical protein
MMSPFAFFASLWSLTLAGYLAPTFAMTSLSGDMATWWPKGRRADWGALLKAERDEALPEIRRPVAASQFFVHAGGSTFQPQRTGRAPAPILANAQSTPLSKGKRSASHAAAEDMSLAELSSGAEDNPASSKRARQGLEMMREVMSFTLSLSDSQPRNGSDDEKMDGVLPIQAPSSNVMCTRPWPLSDSAPTPSPPPPSSKRPKVTKNKLVRA